MLQNRDQCEAFFTYTLHSASSSSIEHVNSEFVPVGRNPEQVASRLNSDVQMSRDPDIGENKSVVLSTEKSVATLRNGFEG